LKPEKILIDESGFVKLCDFSVANQFKNNENTRNTMIGTPEYVAPEMLMQQPYSYAIDWWSLGILL